MWVFVQHPNLKLLKFKWILNPIFNKLQAALVIRGFNIRGFDHSRSQKPRITRENYLLA